MTRRRSPLTSSILAAPALEPLLGRAAECAAAAERLREGARLVTFTGPGGIGKSSVAREVARELARAGGAVVLCELADVTNLEGLLLAVARATGVPGPTAAQRGKTAVDALARRLASTKSLTLVLDDADAVIADAATFVRASFEASEDVRFLVTSREAFGLEGERLIALGPLAPDAALALFRARAGDNAGAWTEADVASLATHLDGLPLGIEIAARRSRLVPPGELLDRLEERFRLLKTDRRDVAARHSTLAATIEWSLARLEPDEALAFAALGVFEGPFAVEAFEAVVGPLLAGDALDAAEALLRKSLVMQSEGHGAARLTMLRTLRAFAREQLKTIDVAKRAEAERRHSEFYVETAEAAAARAYGPGAEEALASIEVDLPNLLRAFEREKKERPALAARAVAAIADVVVLRSAVDLRSPIFREAREAADRSGDPALRVRARVVEAKVTLELAGAAGAEKLLVEAVQIGDDAKLDDAADARRSLAWARIALAQAESALGLLDEALAVHRAKKNVRGEADALAARGLTRCLRGELAAGHADLENAYALHVMAEDAVRREKVIEIATVVGLELGREPDGEGEGATGKAERLRAAAAEHRASGRVWREAVVRFQLAKLENADSVVDSSGHAHAHVVSEWVVGPDARWVRPPGGEPLDLARHGALRKVLDALVTRRITEPGSAMSAIALLEAGWPDEKVRHESGMLRVYSVVRRLRALGVGDVLVTRDDGYLLDPAVRFTRG